MENVNEETSKNKNSKKKWILGTILFLTLGIIGAIFYYEYSTPKVFTKSEYIKEVIVQNRDFENVLEDFLNQVSSYDGSKESTEKLEKTASKFSQFVSSLESKMGPRVPAETKNHYSQMMSAYNQYLEAIELYRKAVPKNLGEERANLLREAENKLLEARNSMSNLKNT